MEASEERAQEIQLAALRLLNTVRARSSLSQRALSLTTGIHRVRLRQFERGEQTPTLVELNELLAASGEHLLLKSEKYRANYREAVEDQILKLYAAGEIQEADRTLKQIRYWSYPLSQIWNRSKRDLAIALSLYFHGHADRAAAYLNNTIMGLALMRFTKEADQLVNMFERVTRKAEQARSDRE